MSSTVQKPVAVNANPQPARPTGQAAPPADVIATASDAAQPATPAHVEPASIAVSHERTSTCLLILGDQLDPHHPGLARLDPKHDRVLMVEAPGEGDHVWSHVARITLFLSAMRHHAETLRAAGWTVEYIGLDDPAPPGLVQRVGQWLAQHPGVRLLCAEPGEWRLEQALNAMAEQQACTLEWLEDPHFLCSRQAFQRWASAYKGPLRMEFFYRWMRRRHAVLMDDADEPVGGRWNFDAENRKAWPASGPGAIEPPAFFEPDPITRQVMADVMRHFGGHPGQLQSFGWPVTRAQALQAMHHFMQHRLARFGEHQDAMWTNTPFGWHALLASSLNLKLLNPREVMTAAVEQWQSGRAPLEAVEGFVRQILGWREFIRGVYWREMPGLDHANHFDHQLPLPAWYWTGQTRMACMQSCIAQTLEHGYAHHIQRLMVTGNFALLAGVLPAEVARWYLAVYVDAVEWVEHPNTLGMALYANGGRFTSKPYVASGAYIKRMSNYCKGCIYQPDVRTGPRACPMTTLYWAFLDRNEAELAASPRTALMVRNLARLTDEERAAIRSEAARMQSDLNLL